MIIQEENGRNPSNLPIVIEYWYPWVTLKLAITSKQTFQNLSSFSLVQKEFWIECRKLGFDFQTILQIICSYSPVSKGNKMLRNLGLQEPYTQQLIGGTPHNGIYLKHLHTHNFKPSNPLLQPQAHCTCFVNRLANKLIRMY